MCCPGSPPLCPRRPHSLCDLLLCARPLLGQPPVLLQLTLLRLSTLTRTLGLWESVEG